MGHGGYIITTATLFLDSLTRITYQSIHFKYFFLILSGAVCCVALVSSRTLLGKPSNAMRTMSATHELCSMYEPVYVHISIV